MPDRLTILALDTASSACSAAVWAEGGVVAQRLATMQRGHAEALMPMVAAVLRESRRGFADLDLVTVTRGPGAFTGLRVGLAAARAIAIAAAVPCVGVTSLEAVALAVQPGQRCGRFLLVALDSKRSDSYVQMFDTDAVPLGAPAALAMDALAAHVATLIEGRGNGGSLLVAGDASAAAAETLAASGMAVRLAAAPGHPDAAVVARIAARRWRKGMAPRSAVAPLYLRPPQATPPVGGGGH